MVFQLRNYGDNPRKHNMDIHWKSIYEQISSISPFECPCNAQYDQQLLPPTFIPHFFSQ